MISKQLEEKKCKLAVIGLGYVGLPIALAFSKKIGVIGFDINEKRIKMLNNHIDPSGQLGEEEFNDSDIIFTNDTEILTQAGFYVIAVPTPVDEHKAPDISLLRIASKTIGKVLKKGDYVVFESTVYPGCTEEDCLPLIEKFSGLTAGIDFKIGYSPERINPGDTEHTLENIVKVVSGCDDEALEQIATVYEMVVKAGVHRASSIKVAEASKIIENTQRDLNIAVMNELSMIFSKMNINTYEVLEAAGTKWNFLRFQPGLVGGHCIGVDPYYLTYKATVLGVDPKLILAGRQINDSMGEYIADTVLKHIVRHNSNIGEAKVLVMGATFKEDVPDIRNSKVADIVTALKSYNLHVHVIDPHASSEELLHEYGFSLTEEIANDYDAVVLAVQHLDYKKLDGAYFDSITKPEALIADLKGLFRNSIVNRDYFSL